MEILRRSPLLVQITAVAAAIILTALIGYQIKHTKSCEEAATVVFTVKQSPAQVNASFDSVQSLTTTGAVMVQTLMSQDSRAIARQAGGTARFNADLVNYYNEDYPEYEYPFVTLVVQGSALVGVQTTFKIVVGMLRNMLSDRQAQAGVPKTQRITISVIDDTGAFVEQPSRGRSYAALCVLSAIATGMSLIFIRRLIPRGRARTSVSRHGAARGPGHVGSAGRPHSTRRREGNAKRPAAPAMPAPVDMLLPAAVPHNPTFSGGMNLLLQSVAYPAVTGLGQAAKYAQSALSRHREHVRVRSFRGRRARCM